MCAARKSNAAGLQAPEEMHDYLKHAQPLPDYSILKAARQLHEQLRSAVGLGTSLSNFAQQLKEMPLKLRRHSLDNLRSQLSREKHDLLAGTAWAPVDRYESGLLILLDGCL